MVTKERMHTITGEILDEYKGKCVGQQAATPSRLFREMGDAE